MHRFGSTSRHSIDNYEPSRPSIQESRSSSRTSLSDDELSIEIETRHTSSNHSVDSHDLEPSQSAPLSGEVLMTSTNPPKNRWRILSCVLFNFTGGFSDAAPGALLPYIEAAYGINYAVTSCIWIGNAIGFIVVASMSHKIQPWLGKRYCFPVANLCSCIFYALVSSGTVFPVIVIGFFFGGCGFAMAAAQCNIFLSRLDKQSTYLSYYHGGYGIGATVAPLIATSMVNRGIKWHYFYLILLGMMIITALNLFYSFENADEDLKPWDHDEDVSQGIEMSDLGDRGDTTNATSKPPSDMILALQNHVTWLIAFFCLFYQGAEVSLAGWIVTYLLDYRHSSEKTTGYVASGLWAGLTLGRLILTRPIHKYIGLKRGVVVISVLSIVLVGLTWGITLFVLEAVLVSIAGVFIGPNYPLLVTFSAQKGLIPRKIQLVSLTIMTAFGSSGGALFPFIVGLLSEKVGTFVVLPVFIALYTSMTILWLMLPNFERRKEAKGKLAFLARIW
ncbi:hypothetical protein CANMA_004345 [Candida margitis]|uniref:uncharacterized protein n=1 Tax=Candida margitis TaxID=1775924 RepID=UPI0022266DC3|nr:uncharacterized protein CANMA_004345 [Candida margitis]KAI5957913.1 hypothetical protein CANMA_004345 [Candida margitis]